MIKYILWIYSILVIGDAFTTWICLSIAIPPGYEVSELNPIVNWFFFHFGLVPSLIVVSIFRIGITWILYYTEILSKMFSDKFAIVFFFYVALITLLAVINNSTVIYLLQ